MKPKQLYFSDNLKPVNNRDVGNNGSSKYSGLSTIIVDTDKASENNLLLRLQEMEERNAHLENIVEHQKKELFKVVATNTKFIAIIAHDLRSPFSSIIGVLEILKKSLSDYNRDEIEKFINIASNAANDTLVLLDNLLMWALSQNEKKSFHPVTINLHEFLAHEIESINTSARQKQIMLHHSIVPNLNVTADLQMISSILRNLMSNAIKYTNTGGEITISASESKQFVEIEVRDTGIGISHEGQRNLFKIDEFHSTAGTHNEKGAGFGLLLCKEFVEIHGGKIWVESEPGNGSKFKFALPIIHKASITHANAIAENV